MNLTKVDRVPIITNDHIDFGGENSVAEPNVWDDWTWWLAIFMKFIICFFEQPKQCICPNNLPMRVFGWLCRGRRGM